jgi:hypothetical protein
MLPWAFIFISFWQLSIFGRILDYCYVLFIKCMCTCRWCPIFWMPFPITSKGLHAVIVRAIVNWWLDQTSKDCAAPYRVVLEKLKFVVWPTQRRTSVTGLTPWRIDREWGRGGGFWKDGSHAGLINMWNVTADGCTGELERACQRTRHMWLVQAS